MEELILDFYGVVVRVQGPCELLEKLGKDFSYFRRPSGPETNENVNLAVSEQRPPYGEVPSVRAFLYGADSISYDHHHKRYVDYFGKALAVYDYGAEKGELYSEDRDLMHELAYLLIHSRAGELLDRKGIHRVHALGITMGGKGVLCLLPQGGGKTTLGLALLKKDGVRLLSDDTPLITREGKILPFPVRIGVHAREAADIPERFTGQFNRRKYGTKTVIDIAYFKDVIAGAAEPSVILIGQREFSANPRFVPQGRFSAFIPLVKNCIVGLGLPQMIEYFLRFDAGDMAAKAGLVFSRMMACLRLLARSEVYTFVMGTDTKKNADVLIEFLSKLA